MRQPAPVTDRLLALIDDFAGIRVAVFGDLLADEFIYGQIARVSREAPVLILNYDSTEIVPGGAGNAAKNVAALGGAPSAIGVVGADETGDRLVAALGRGVDGRGIVRPRGYRTPTKTRILAGGVHSAKQQVVRIDRAVRPAALRRRPARGRSEAGLGRGALRRAARVRLRHRPRHAGASCAGRSSASQVPGDRLPCSSTPATRCSGSGA